MFDITKDIQSVSTFRRNPALFIKQLKKTKRPVVLTVKGKAAAVIQDAEAYQRLLDIAARVDVNEGIRKGLEDVAMGRTRPTQQVFSEIRDRWRVVDVLTIRHGVMDLATPEEMEAWYS